MTTKITAEEAFESLTGYEELGIEKAFKVDITALSDSKPTIFMRALVFALKRREGLTHDKAYDAAMTLSLKDAQDFFAESDVMPDEPDTSAGEAFSASE